MQDQDNFLKMAYILVTSFFSGFAVGINAKAYDDKTTFMQFLAKILMHGLSGAILGLIATHFISEPMILGGIAGIGGLFGEQLLKTITNDWLNNNMSSKQKDKDPFIK